MAILALNKVSLAYQERAGWLQWGRQNQPVSFVVRSAETNQRRDYHQPGPAGWSDGAGAEKPSEYHLAGAFRFVCTLARVGKTAGAGKPAAASRQFVGSRTEPPAFAAGAAK